MSTSGGGGYCDCGDKEAWREDPFCERHMAGQMETSTAKCPIDNLPADMQERAKQLFSVAMNYGAEMLTWESRDELPADLSVEEKEGEKPDKYVTMLFNDEVHTYEQVSITVY